MSEAIKVGAALFSKPKVKVDRVAPVQETPPTLSDDTLDQVNRSRQQERELRRRRAGRSSTLRTDPATALPQVSSNKTLLRI